MSKLCPLHFLKSVTDVSVISIGSIAHIEGHICMCHTLEFKFTKSYKL